MFPINSEILAHVKVCILFMQIKIFILVDNNKYIHIIMYWHRYVDDIDRGITLIPGFIQSPPKLAIYDIVHFLPLGGAGMDFSFTEDETRRHFSYLSGTFREFLCLCMCIRNYIFKVIRFHRCCLKKMMRQK